MSFKIKENVAWVGKIGWELRRFHGEEYSTPRWMCSEQFIEFLNSPEARDIIKKHHYFSSKEDVFAWIGGTKPIGGSYTVPQEWLK
jgi:hypothetical protein